MDDQELVQQAQSGDAGAFDRLVELHQPRIYATLAKMTGDRDLALDLTQDAFIRAWERLDRFEGRSRFSTWLYRIAVRLTYDALEREGRRVDDTDVAAAIDPAPGAVEDLEAAEAAAELRRRIAALPKLQRAVVVMRTYDGLPYREIADILATTETSARVSFHHAITRLREGYLKEARAE